MVTTIHELIGFTDDQARVSVNEPPLGSGVCMQIIRGAAGLPNAQGPCAVGIGIFDGVHLGHQALLRHVVDAASQKGIKAVA